MARDNRRRLWLTCESRLIDHVSRYRFFFRELSQYKKAKRGKKKVSQRQQLKKSRRGESQAEEAPHLQVESVTVNEGSSDQKKGPQANDFLCLGVNHVTRALEKDELCLAIVCKDAEPPRLVQHFPYLAFVKQVPLCAMAQRGSSFELGKIFGLKSMLALGFKVLPPPPPPSLFPL